MKCVMVLVLAVLLIGVAASRWAARPTALGAWLAIERGDARALRDLLERGLDPNTALGELTLLMHAAHEGQPACVGTLIEMGAEVDRAADCNGATALTWAAWKGNGASVRCLLDAGADVNAPMIQGWRPLTLAAMSGDLETVRALLAAGADAHAQTAAGVTAAESAESHGHTQVAGLLREAAGMAAHENRGARSERRQVRAP